MHHGGAIMEDIIKGILKWQLVSLDIYFHWTLFLGWDGWEAVIGLDIVLAPIKQQAIININDDLV